MSSRAFHRSTAPARAARNATRNATLTGPQARELAADPLFALGVDRPTEQSSWLQDALAYASAGMRVLPLHTIREGGCTCGDRLCERPGEHPIKALVPDGVEAATTDHARIKEWWTARPDASVGIATGAESGIIALHVDQTARGEEQLASLEQKHGPLPLTAMSAPVNGTVCILFKHPNRPLGPSQQVRPGLTVLADDGYLVAPEEWRLDDGRSDSFSTHPGDLVMAAAPDWLLALFQAEAMRGRNRQASTPQRQAEPVVACLPLPSAGATPAGESCRSVEDQLGQPQDAQRALVPLSQGADSGLEPVRHHLPNAPAAGRVPSGWQVDSQGVARVGSGGRNGSYVQPVAPTPILIVARLKDVSTGTESVRLAWQRDGRWQCCTVERVKVASARQIVDLAALGLPVTSKTAHDLVEYLAAFEAANMACLPPIHVSGQMGWHGNNGDRGFLWGRTHLGPQGTRTTVADLDDPASEASAQGLIVYRGADVGEEQLADGYHAAGSLDGWLGAIESATAYPRVLLAVYAALVPPLLAVLDAPNFIVDWSYTTSTGKTTTLRLAASCWGNPDEHELAAAIGTWDATRVSIERLSTAQNGLPLILDDTKRVRQPKAIAQVLYDVANGRGRTRGSTQGMRPMRTSRTVLLSTGETPITSFTEDGGTRARTLELWGPPFGRADSTTAPVVHQLDLAVRQHYGHAGPVLIEFIIAHADDWPAWRAEYQRLRGVYTQQAGASPVAGRLTAYFAAINMAAWVAHAALELPWPYQDPVHAVLDDLLAGASDADRATQALRHVVSWAQGNQHAFFGRHQTDSTGGARISTAGWAGRWNEGQEWEYLAFLPHRLKELLEDASLDYEATIRVWRDRGWLETDGDRGRNTKRVRLDGETPRMVVIRRAAIEEVESE